MIRTKIVRLLETAGNVILRPAGLVIGGRNPGPGEIVPRAALTQNEAVGHLRWLRDNLGFSPRCIADLGASDGRWARPVKKIFPHAKLLLVEPQTAYGETLQALADREPDFVYDACAVGDTQGVVELHCHGHQTSLYGDSRGRPFGTVTNVPMKTLDSLVREHDLPWPELIKMDIQGAELRALRGALQCLEHAEFVQTEFSLLPVQKDIPLLGELVVCLSQHGFRIFNVYGVCGRPLDGMPVQGEILFVRKQSPLITDMRWSETSNWS